MKTVKKIIRENELTKDIHTYWNRDFYSIYMCGSEKRINMEGYFYDEGEDNGYGTSRELSYSGFDLPLTKFISGDFDYDAYQSGLSQYIEDMDENEAVRRMDTKTVTPLSFGKLTLDTPCGSYVNYDEEGGDW